MKPRKLVAAILSHLSKNKRNRVLEYIDRRDHALAELLKEMLVTSETIFALRPDEMALLHRNLDIKDIALLFKTASDPLKAKLLEGISEKRKQTIIEEYELLGPVKKREVQKAEEQVVGTLKRLIDSGEITPGEAWIE